MSEMVIEEESSKIWRVLEVSYPSVFQNLALEEALTRSRMLPTFRPIVRLWRNPPSVIVGRFQNVGAEVDVELCEQNDIAIARRFTGGGSVFHDMGNLNLTLVTGHPEGITLGQLHEKNASIILDLLARLEAEGVLVRPNSIHVGGRKISGAAAALGQRFALWHASILISTDVLMLQRVLAPSQVIRETRSIRSNWHPVTTLAEVLHRSVDLEHVQRTLLQSCRSALDAKLERSELLEDEKQYSKFLYERKYASQDWNLHGNWKSEELEGKCSEAHTTIAV